MRILIVEDDQTIADILERHLAKWGYEILTLKRFDTVLESFLSFQPHLVLLDIALPFYSGFYWCNEIRKHSKVPVIFISSASDEMNQVMALNMGGDDFICKPFHLEVVVAKVRALLRRSYEMVVESSVLQVGRLRLDLAQAVVLSETAEPIALTRNELLILSCLMEQPSCPVSREELMRRLWQDEHYIDDNTLTVNITRLRKKLEEAGFDNLIVTRKGLGYQVEDHHG